MGEDITIHVEAEAPEVVEEAPAPVVIVAPGFADSFPVEFSELVQLRAEKAEREEQRLADIEADAAAALAIAELVASEPVEVEESVIVEEEPIEETPPQADSEPDNSHPFFKKW